MDQLQGAGRKILMQKNRREWNVLNDKNSHLTVFHWNALADYLSDAFPNTDPQVLKWEYRCPLHLEVLRKCDADFISLVEIDHYDDVFSNELSSLGYRSIFKKKVNDSLDGCVLCWKSSITLVDSMTIEYMEGFSQVAIVGCFTMENGMGVCVATTHLKASVGNEDVREREGRILIEKISAFNTNNYPVIICGDFNDVPDSLVSNVMQSNHYSPGSSMNQWTTWKKREEVVKRTIDYIWHSSGLTPVSILSVPEDESCPVFLPAIYYPSDHLAISVKYSFDDSSKM